MQAGYADLEISLMHCVQIVGNDFDAVLKKMFGTRGAEKRIERAVRIGGQHYDDLGIGTQFETAVESVDYCREIRNQYAHCIWWDDLSGQLAFANLEWLAKDDALVENLSGLTPNYLDVPLLEEQLAYYEYAELLLKWVKLEGMRLAGQSSQRFEVPEHQDQPRRFISP